MLHLAPEISEHTTEDEGDVVHARSMAAGRARCTAKTDESGHDHFGGTMDPTRNDVLRAASSAAHEDSHDENDKRVAYRHGTSRRTANRWRNEGHPDWLRAMSYAQNTPHPERLVAQAKALLRQHVRRMTRDQMVREYRDLLLAEPAIEADDRLSEMDHGCGWLDRARTSECDAGMEEKKAALEVEFEVRRRKGVDGCTVGEVMREVLHV